jgi:hypothetical protein
MTKNELLALAKTLNIAGRHDMTKEQLQAAVDAETPSEDTLTGNYIYTAPFRIRLYSHVYTNPEAYDKLAPQAKKIFDFMKETKIVASGHAIVVAAVAAGKLKTTQDPAVLFAFYARKLEDAGIRLAAEK